MTLRDIQEEFEWNCNSTNNDHCRIVTELVDDGPAGRRALRIWPRTDEKGEYVKVSGWGNVLRDAFKWEREGEVTVHASPGQLTLVGTK